jgi:hypothetical protein
MVDVPHELAGHHLGGAVLIGGQVALLDPVGLAAITIVGGHDVVELLALCAHSADVEVRVRFDAFPRRLDVFADGESEAAEVALSFKCG